MEETEVKVKEGIECPACGSFLEIFCPECGLLLTPKVIKGGLIPRKRKEGREKKGIKCPECGTLCKTKQGLRLHRYHKHES